MQYIGLSPYVTVPNDFPSSQAKTILYGAQILRYGTYQLDVGRVFVSH
jgi:hypothetical protein